MSRYPHQLDLPPDYSCVFERDGGTLLATKAVDVIQVLVVYIIMYLLCMQSTFLYSRTVLKLIFVI